MPKRPEKLSEARREALGRALERALRGEVRFDSTNRAAYASDSSNYRQVPLGVVFPATMTTSGPWPGIAAEAGAALLARGAGTSLAGQTCNEAVVRRHEPPHVPYRRHRPRAHGPPRSNRAWCSTTCAVRPSAAA